MAANFADVGRFFCRFGTGGFGGRRVAAHFRFLWVSWYIAGIVEYTGKLVSEE